MAFPTFVGHGGAVQESTSTLTVVNNASAATGDYEVLIVETMDEAATLTTSGGFTEHPGSPVSAPSGTATVATRLTAFERIYSGQVDPVLADAGNHVIANIFTFRKSSGTWSALSDVRSAVDGTGWNATAETTEDGSGSMDGITTDTADQLICGFMCHAKPDIAGGTAELSGITNSNLANITERHDDAAASGNGGWIGAWTGQEATSGQAIGATTYTKATVSYKADLVIAIRDAAPAAAVTFEASIAGTGTVAAALVETKTFAVSISGLGAVTAQLDMTRTLEAAIAGTGTVTADFVRDKLVFEVGVAGTGAVVTEFALVKLMAVDVAGTSQVVADFVRQIGLEAAIAGLGVVSADTVSQKALEAAIAGSGAVSVAVANQIGLEVVVAGVSQVLADFVRSPLFLEAAIAGNGTVTVDITVTTPGGDVLILRTLVGVGL